MKGRGRQRTAAHGRTMVNDRRTGTRDVRVQVWRARAVERRFTVFEKKSPAASEKRETQKDESRSHTSGVEKWPTRVSPSRRTPRRTSAGSRRLRLRAGEAARLATSRSRRSDPPAARRFASPTLFPRTRARARRSDWPTRSSRFSFFSKSSRRTSRVAETRGSPRTPPASSRSRTCARCLAARRPRRAAPGNTASPPEATLCAETGRDRRGEARRPTRRARRAER